ncbi:MAG: Gfo/Idh/MocA family oxidoreductase [Pseudomonadota bacterium]|nr:Gfo/Idh/MocA family oxidoreductase [Pseudomonadota bacterium]
MAERKLRLGVAGLGRAFTLMLPTLSSDKRLQLVAAADTRAQARERFAADFAARAYATVEELCDDGNVEAVYVATPHQHHAKHVQIAASRGKHVLVEKPMAVTLRECQAMVAAAHRGKVQLVVGHSHSFNAPILRAREIIAGGLVGKVRMISALNYTDYMYRPRRLEELDTAQGGGVLFSQAAHQIDIVRLLGGGRVRSVRAATGSWDAARPTEGAYATFLTFEDGAFASAVYSGYGHFDSDEFSGWIGEMGLPKDRDRYGAARKALQHVSNAAEEAALKNARSYGGRDYTPPANADPASRLHQHFGLVLVSCERADLRPLPNGVVIYEDFVARLDAVTVPDVPRAEVIDEFYDAVIGGRPPLHSGEWALATTEVCLAMLRSAREQKEIKLKHQVGVPDTAERKLTA